MYSILHILEIMFWLNAHNKNICNQEESAIKSVLCLVGLWYEFQWIEKTSTKVVLCSPQSICLLVVLWAGWHKNYWMDFPKTLNGDGSQPSIDPINFWCGSIGTLFSLSLTLWDKGLCKNGNFLGSIPRFWWKESDVFRWLVSMRS